jgi:hypothetical protein
MPQTVLHTTLRTAQMSCSPPSDFAHAVPPVLFEWLVEYQCFISVAAKSMPACPACAAPQYTVIQQVLHIVRLVLSHIAAKI